MTLGIICLLIVGPTFENTLVALAVYGGIIIGMILAWWYSQKASGGIADFFMGSSGSAKVNKTLALGKQYEAERNYKAAIEQYNLAIKKNKKDPEPRRRLVELYKRLRNIDKTIQYMQELVDLPKGVSVDERCTLMNRMADLYLSKKNDRQSAVAILERLEKEFAGTKYAEYARDRIAEIKKG
jgi:tetratricopeptide (TPR) repeat protein